MLKLNLTNHRITIDPLSLTIEPLRKVYEEDEDPLKRRSTDILSYVHLVSRIDMEAPFFSARADQVEELSAINIWGKNYKHAHPDLSVFRYLIEAYLEAFDRPEVRIVVAYNDKIDQLQDMVEETVPAIEKSSNKTSGTFTYVSNTTQLMKVMKEIRVIINEKNELEEMIRQGAEKDTKRWGGRSESFLEKKKKRNSTNKTRASNETASQRSKESESDEEGVSQNLSQVPAKF